MKNNEIGNMKTGTGTAALFSDTVAVGDYGERK